MPRVTQRAKSKVKARKAPVRRRKSTSKRSPVSRKATNWLHARARDVKRGHNVRGTVLGLVGGFCAVLLAALWFSGGMNAAVQATGLFAEKSLLAAGFRVDHIEVVDFAGNEMSALDKVSVRRALAVEEGEMVFSVNLKQARRRIEDIGWVKQARIVRQLPNRLTVIVMEREPYALWQSLGQWKVISQNGSVIVSAKAADHPTLPLVVGKGGPQELQAFLATMQRYPRIAATVRAYVRVSERRWNLRLDNGTDLMLPAKAPENALVIFENEAGISPLLSLPLERIDARLPAQIFVRPRTALKSVKPETEDQLS